MSTDLLEKNLLGHIYSEIAFAICLTIGIIITFSLSVSSIQCIDKNDTDKQSCNDQNKAAFSFAIISFILFIIFIILFFRNFVVIRGPNELIAKYNVSGSSTSTTFGKRLYR